MMVERKHMITSKQLQAFITSAQIGIGILVLPAKLARDVGHDGWISFVLAGTISIMAAIIIVKLLQLYKDKSIYEINRVIFGKFMGNIMNILILLYLLYATAIGIRIFASVINIIILRLTPPVLITIYVLIPTMYLIWYGLKAVSRFANLIYLIMLVTIIFFLLISKYLRVTLLLPVGDAGLHQIIKGVFPSMFALLGFELTAIIYPNITDKDKVLKNVIRANVISIIYILLNVLVITSFFGETMTSNLLFPLFTLARSYKAPILERIDMYYITLWFPAMAISLRAYFLSTHYSINRVFKIKKTTLSLILLSSCAIFLSRLPRDFNEVNKYAEILNIIGLGFITYLIICYFIAIITKRGVQK